MLRRAIGSRLERGSFDGVPSRLLASTWALLSRPARPLELPAGARVIGVGGATLGGSGKTPLVLALAKRLAREHSVAVVAHGYRARPRAARVVSVDDHVEDVGDEALWLARELSPLAAVVVSSDRGAALELAARHGSFVIVDGLLQTRPRRLFASLLVLGADRPWGARRCPPAGDLRAAPRALLDACDRVLVGPVEPAATQGRTLMAFDEVLSGARTPAGELIGFEDLRRRRVGVALAIARPERVLDALRARGVEPLGVTLAADHAVPRPPRPRAPVEAWLTTAKCATKLGDRLAGAPVWVLRHELRLPAELALWLGSRSGR